MDEKVLPRTRRFNAVGFCLTAIRIWQWSSSFFVFGSFSLLYAHVQKNKLGENNRMKAVEILGLISLVYTTVIIVGVHICKTLGLKSWRIFAMISLPGDVTTMGLFIAKITILSYSGLPVDCHGLTRDNYDDNDLVRQPADGYSTIRFGSWATAMTGELDRWCTFPRTVYGLSIVAIYSYTFSLLLSMLYLQQLKREALGSEKPNIQPSSPRLSVRYVGELSFSSVHTPSSILHLDLNSEPTSPGPSSQHISSRTPSRQGSTRSVRTFSTSSNSSSWGAITLGSSDTESVRSGGSLPPPPIPGSSSNVPQRRWSTSTSSSYNANAFIVTDGFYPTQAEVMPPAYESRPGSLYNETMKYPAGLGMPGTPKP